MMDDLLGKKYVANSELVRSDEEDGCLIFNPETGSLQALNESGAYLYELLSEAHTGVELVESLLGDFEGIERTDAETDVSEFLQLAIRLGLVCEV